MSNTRTPHVIVSAETGSGITELAALIARTVKGDNEEPPAIAPNFRQMDAVSRAIASLEKGITSLTMGLSPELAAIDIRNSYDILGGIRGEGITGDILDHIFTNFCLGK
jgi:tRNA modification GTPase